MRRFVMGEGGGMPRHTNTVEHEVSAGEVLYIPAGVPHSYRVLEAPFEFLCMVPNGPDELRILDPSC
jgi:quercetin dioxygenase-like cupin family protein